MNVKTRVFRHLHWQLGFIDEVGQFTDLWSVVDTTGVTDQDVTWGQTARSYVYFQAMDTKFNQKDDFLRTSYFMHLSREQLHTGQ